MRPCFIVIPWLLISACAVWAVKIELLPGSPQCISETFPQVADAAQPLLFRAALRVFGGGSADGGGGGGGSRVAATVQGPQGVKILQQQALASHADLSAPAAGYGTYTLCLTTAADSRVVVDIQRLALGSNGNGSHPSSGGGSSSQVHPQLSPVHDQIIWLQDLLQQLRLEQRAMRERLDRHFATNLDTSHRTLYSSLAEVAALLATTFLQVVAIQCFFRRHSDTISRRMSAQALAQCDEEPQTELTEQSPAVSFSRGSAGSGGRLARSFSRRRLGSEVSELEGIAVDLFGSPASDSKLSRDRRWGSSGSISQLAALAASPAPHAQDPGFSQPGVRHAPPGRRSVEASPLRRHSTHAEPTLQRPPDPGDASSPLQQHLPQLQPIAGSPAVASPALGLPPAFLVQQQTPPQPQQASPHAVWQQPSGAWESVACLIRSGSAASIESLEST